MYEETANVYMAKIQPYIRANEICLHTHTHTQTHTHTHARTSVEGYLSSLKKISNIYFCTLWRFQYESLVPEIRIKT